MKYSILGYSLLSGITTPGPTATSSPLIHLINGGVILGGFSVNDFADCFCELGDVVD